MRAEVARDLSDSAHDFLRVVWPAVEGFCQGGELRSVESVTAKDFERQLDMLSGIDAWQIVDGVGIRGISSRIQWVKPGRGWPTFTIRKSRSSGAKTEWAKRVEAKQNPDNGFIKPGLIVHAYVQFPRRKGDLEYVCMCKCDDLFSLATDDRKANTTKLSEMDFQPEKAWYEQVNPTDGNTFAVFPVERLRSLGIRVKTWDRQDHIADQLGCNQNVQTEHKHATR